MVSRARDTVPPSIPSPSSQEILPHGGKRSWWSSPYKGVHGSPEAKTSSRSLRGRGGTQIDPLHPTNGSSGHFFDSLSWRMPAPCGCAQPSGLAALWEGHSGDVADMHVGKQCPGVCLNHWGAVGSGRISSSTENSGDTILPSLVGPQSKGAMLPEMSSKRWQGAKALGQMKGEKRLRSCWACTLNLAP